MRETSADRTAIANGQMCDVSHRLMQHRQLFRDET